MKKEFTIEEIVAGGLYKTRMPLISNPEELALGLGGVVKRDTDTFLEYLKEKGYEIIKS